MAVKASRAGILHGLRCAISISPMRELAAVMVHVKRLATIAMDIANHATCSAISFICAEMPNATLHCLRLWHLSETESGTQYMCKRMLATPILRFTQQIVDLVHEEYKEWDKHKQSTDRSKCIH